MTEPSGPCGRYIHTAADAIRTVRNTALDRAGITFTQWKVLDKAPGNNRNELIRKLVDLAVDDEAGATQAINELREQGLISAGEHGHFELTAQGESLSQRVSASRTDLQTQLYDGIAAEDLATTKRVLNLITERARVVHARQ